MKNSLLWKVLLCLFLMVFSPAISTAKRYRTASRITAVSDHSITIAVGHAQHSYKITKETQIHLDGRRANARDLSKGMPAEVTASQIDPKIAIAIEAQHQT